MAPAVLPHPAKVATPIRVVLADDSAAIRTLARHALSAHRGFEVTEAVDGVEALEALELVHPDCVVLDIQMPRMGGFEALAELRERSPEVPVILLSGQSDEEVADEARRLGAVSYVNKVTSLGTLADAVRQVTRGAREQGDEVEPNDAAASAGIASLPVVATPTDAGAGSETGAALEMRRLEYVVSHDLGEPLRIMSGFAGLLDSRYAESLDDSGRTFVTHIVDAAARMQQMLEDLLLYSRGGRAEPARAEIEIGDVAGRVVESLQDEITTRGAEVKIGSLPSAVGDATMLQTVLRQVIVNALRFNGSVPPVVTVEGTVEGATALVTVHDNGIGVPEPDQERVFELFVRLHARESYPGTGTGLALCRRLMAAQGGSIHLDSSSDDGTTVTLALPTTG
jgi:signal transduction histidine kinase